ncbi:carbon-nitrogen hydrolase [Radiomyces spectabilis]|uniref:carbon-nitrogen hydrolase n=1 Tax=Radiomyces spectabilis TaxID=64574 RepID=UPI00221F68CD|nr:carbon-nitrogen hydrolase [Radiomyces spectabilis]KAI8393469.1 carbon-nitrogen hydrolase [Radiomyces spectabilis]
MMRIAAVQFHINHEDKDENWIRIEQYLAKAAETNVDLVVFPEYFVGGPGTHVVNNGARNRFCDLARKYELDIVPGTVIERDPHDGHLYNCAYYIDKSGEVLLEYRKVHLWHPEREYMKGGKHGFATVKNRFGITLGMCVCWDIAFPEGFRHMVLKHHAQLVIAPAYWSFEDAGEVGQGHDSMSEAKLINAVCTARAFENEICMVFVNAANESDVDRPQPFGQLAGRTQITVPFKGPVAQCDHNRQEMLVADVDISGLTNDAEKVYQIRKDWREGKIFGGQAKQDVETFVPQDNSH